MNIEQLQNYCISKKATTEEFPFDADTLVFKVLGKVFALIGLEKWEAGQKAINLKCDPDYAEELRSEYAAIKPGYHMNKKHWNTVDLTGSEISPKFLSQLIDHSYDMVVKGMTKKMRDSLL
ncbi:MmcQ/YjbR family DNA-binding protein [Subsaximicrobium wynnwilliamsii]|uniref:MmcQ/YjbR family DNA-binding protein n=1 Tax=Subsaximicrobium wynnwilliamsii TaxID=291179 RepID=A0A5C6ZJZ9_9FLAO|nr:MmcQ/YjbR family DNA-binding protein [Subsaximicrobium wynnwilliamsii]TXD83647.1 MmcQ/YjbR family DNA-binding protein [Subsaximicrobium wynnwilliamsii]TXD89468.1 MmcQ/YjbR family DNA-binding protein [Subsaximicrobium wynnwilliamsii]TXE03484.1 MmcQ/YjbR family DNA-binding protein [Subsaximicrobium wynnwilliamsii]